MRQSMAGYETLSVSVGYAFYPADGTNAEELLAEADRRMYGVKRDHRALSLDERKQSRAQGASA